MTPWSDEQKAAFLQLAVRQQHHYYRQHYPTCEFLIVEEPDGIDMQADRTVEVDRWADQIRWLMSRCCPLIAAGVTAWRCSARILRKGEAGLPVTIHVEANQPARWRLDPRLGFPVMSIDNGVDHLMKW